MSASGFTATRWMKMADSAFEKMLYDQALAAMAYLEAWQCSRIELFSQTAEEVFAYALRDLRPKKGPFIQLRMRTAMAWKGPFISGA